MTGERTEAVKPHTDVWEWYADSDGVVRAGLGFLSKSWFMLYRRSADEPLRKLGHASYEDDSAGMLLLGLASDSDDGYLLSDQKTGRYALYRYNYATQQLGEVVYENPVNDIDDYALSRDGKRVMSVAYTDDRERVVWLDPAMRTNQDKLEARFPGLSVLFVSRDDARERFIVWVGGANDPGSYYIFAPGADILQRVARINGQLDPAQLAATEYTRYTARDGLEIPAFLTLPRGREARGLPLIVMPQGQARRLTRPVLLAHGDKDKQVLFKQSTLYRDALAKAGKPHEFVSYPGEGHGFENPDNFTDWLTRLEAFLQVNNPAQ